MLFLEKMIRANEILIALLCFWETPFYLNGFLTEKNLNQQVAENSSVGQSTLVIQLQSVRIV